MSKVFCLSVLAALSLSPLSAKTLWVVGDGNVGEWFGAVSRQGVFGENVHLIDFGKQSVADTLAGGKWKEFLSRLRDSDVALISLGNNDLRASKEDEYKRGLTEAVTEIGRHGIYCGILPVHSDDPQRKARYRELFQKAVGAARGYKVMLMRDIPVTKYTPSVYAETVFAEAYMWLYAIIACDIDSVWFRSLVQRKYAEVRKAEVKPVGEGELRLTPTFSGCGVDFGAKKELPELSLQYRKENEPWRTAAAFPYFSAFGEYRGSLLRLDENTRYQVRLVSRGRTVKSGRFLTWKNNVPVEKTVTISQDTEFPVVISAKGSESAWIRYTVAPGTELVNNTDRPSVIVEKSAAFILIDDIVFRGGKNANVIRLDGPSFVRVRNCEFSGWGRAGQPDYFRHAGQYVTDKGQWVNFDGAVKIAPHTIGAVIERCWMHDPLSRANSWFYSHPAGPEAVTVEYPDHSTVIRWCDFTGSDCKMWNDAVEGAGNFSDDGGFNRDADVYGNFMIGSNDDSIELDGGMRNVRCYDNRFEASPCGVSIQGCMVSPVYVFDNLFSGMTDEHGLIMQTIKTSSFDRRVNGSWAWIAGNTMWGSGSGLQLQDANSAGRYTVTGNVFCGEMQRLSGTNRIVEGNCLIGGNVFGAEIPEEKLDASFPKRPLPFMLDRARFSRIKIGRSASPAPVLKVKAVHDGTGAPVKFKIAKNDVFDWFEVVPAEGRISKGGTVEFTVTFKPELMTSRRHYRGSFLVRTPDGLSRPVSLSAETDFIPPLKPEIGDGFAAYIDVFAPKEGGKIKFIDDPAGYAGRMADAGEGKSALNAEYEFTVPSDGEYFTLLHAYTPGHTVMNGTGDPKTVFHEVVFEIDGKEHRRLFMTRDYPVWLHGGRLSTKSVKLAAGPHRLRVYTRNGIPLRFDSICVTDALGAFEPR